jgi:hypothetical protein
MADPEVSLLVRSAVLAKGVPVGNKRPPQKSRVSGSASDWPGTRTGAFPRVVWIVATRVRSSKAPGPRACTQNHNARVPIHSRLNAALTSHPVAVRVLWGWRIYAAWLLRFWLYNRGQQHIWWDGSRVHGVAAGLHSMRERAKLMGSKLTVWSQIGSGTEIELSLPGSHAYEKSLRDGRSWVSEFAGKVSRKGAATRS